MDLRIPISTMKDMEKNLVLNADFIPISCPVCLLHGMKDDTIPYQTSLRVAEKLASNCTIIGIYVYYIVFFCSNLDYHILN